MWYKGYDGEAQVWDTVSEDIVCFHSDAWCSWDPFSFILPCISLLADKVLQDLQNTPLLDFCLNSLIFSTVLIFTVYHLHWPFLPIFFRPVMLLLISWYWHGLFLHYLPVFAEMLPCQKALVTWHYNPLEFLTLYSFFVLTCYKHLAYSVSCLFFPE